MTQVLSTGDSNAGQVIELPRPGLTSLIVTAVNSTSLAALPPVAFGYDELFVTVAPGNQDVGTSLAIPGFPYASGSRALVSYFGDFTLSDQTQPCNVSLALEVSIDNGSSWADASLNGSIIIDANGSTPNYAASQLDSVDLDTAAGFAILVRVKLVNSAGQNVQFNRARVAVTVGTG